MMDSVSYGSHLKGFEEVVVSLVSSRPDGILWRISGWEGGSLLKLGRLPVDKEYGSRNKLKESATQY